MTIIDATKSIMKSYLEILHNILSKEINSHKIEPLIHLISVIETALREQNIYEDKLSRWLGYVQGMMSAHGWLSVNDARVSTRYLFHKAYTDMGLEIPKSISVSLNDVRYHIVSMQELNDRAIKKYGVVSYKELSPNKLNKIGMKMIKHHKPNLHKFLSHLDYDMVFVNKDGNIRYSFCFTNLRYKIV